MKRWLVLAVLAGCTTPVGPPDAACDGPLFGSPVTSTGLSAAQCGPRCACGATPFDSPVFSSQRLDALKAWALADAGAELTTDPYAQPPPAPDGGVCAVVVIDQTAKTYRLQTFADPQAAATAGAILTHHDACGLCSTLADLAVYARDPDLGAPVRQCGIDTFSTGFEADVTCLQALGFTRPCAQIWAYNTQHTRSKCFEPCVLAGGAPYHESDGGLNACLACDEVKSGPVFKAVAGRTRRNTGIASAICRPCSEARPVPHDYP